MKIHVQSPRIRGRPEYYAAGMRLENINSSTMKYLLVIALLLVSGSLVHAEAEWTALFDGKTLNGWNTPDGKPAAGWLVEADGVLHFTGKGPFLLSEKEFTSFELEWEWKLAAGSNNGIKYWSTKVGGKEWLGIEYQMIDDLKHPDGLRGGSHDTGSIYDIFDSSKDKKLLPVGEWNKSRVVVKDGKIEHWLNGSLAASADTKSEEWKAHIARSKFKGKADFAPGHGRIMLTAHGDPAWFRNVRIRGF